MITTQLNTSAHGFDDYDVSGLSKVHRVCIGHGIQKGDLFNVYLDDGVKLGATWRGSVEKSLEQFATNNATYRQLCGT